MNALEAFARLQKEGGMDEAQLTEPPPSDKSLSGIAFSGSLPSSSTHHHNARKLIAGSEKLEWMYSDPAAAMEEESAEDYLLGKKKASQDVAKDIDSVKALEKSGDAAGSLFLASAAGGRIASTTEDTLRKLREDPLTVIKQAELQHKRRQDCNPLLRDQRAKEEKRKREKIKKKKKKKTKTSRRKTRSSSSESSHSDSSSLSSSTSSSPSRSSRNRARSRHTSESKHHSAGHRHDSPSSSKKQETRGNHSSALQQHHHRSKQQGNRRSSRERTRRLTDEEKKRKVLEMQRDASELHMNRKRKHQKVEDKEKALENLDLISRDMTSRRDEGVSAGSSSSTKTRFIEKIRRDAFSATLKGGGAMADYLHRQTQRRQRNDEDALEADDEDDTKKKKKQ